MVETMGGAGRDAAGYIGARTPEELEALFEDSCVTRDHTALADLFENRAVLVADDGRAIRGSDAIAGCVAKMWEDGGTYVADPLRVVQARDLALIVGEHAINVARRGGDGDWRYVIAFLLAAE